MDGLLYRLYTILATTFVGEVFLPRRWWLLKKEVLKNILASSTS
jgi:hypothetical protein